MHRWVVCACLGIGGVASAQLSQESSALLDRITAKLRADLNRLPEYVCGQTLDRSRRYASAAAFTPLDTLRLDVALVGNRELYSWRDAGRFEEKDLGDLVDRGVVGTGNFALLARHVFLSRHAEFSFRGPEPLHGRRAVRFDYQVPLEHSTYRVRVPPRQAVVAFEGSVWADPEICDLLRLEVRALDIPEPLGLAEASSVMEYSRALIGDSETLLPRSAELRTINLAGEESLNVARFQDCRRYRAESSLSFTDPPPGAPARTRSAPAPGVPLAALLELSLSDDIDLENASAGDPVRALLVRPLRDGGRIVAPEGTAVLGQLLRIEKQTLPFDHYTVAFELHTLDLGDQGRARFAATMAEISPATGLLRQARKFNPTFTTKRAPRMEILVAEQHPGQGVVEWDARHPRMRKGLKMRWQTIAAAEPGRNQ